MEVGVEVGVEVGGGPVIPAVPRLRRGGARRPASPPRPSLVAAAGGGGWRTVAGEAGRGRGEGGGDLAKSLLKAGAGSDSDC